MRGLLTFSRRIAVDTYLSVYRKSVRFRKTYTNHFRVQNSNALSTLFSRPIPNVFSSVTFETETRHACTYIAYRERRITAGTETFSILPVLHFFQTRLSVPGSVKNSILKPVPFLLLQPTKLQTQIAILNVIRSGFGFRFPAAHRVKLSSRPASSFSVRASFSVWELLAKERSNLTTYEYDYQNVSTAYRQTRPKACAKVSRLNYEVYTLYIEQNLQNCENFDVPRLYLKRRKPWDFYDI